MHSRLLLPVLGIALLAGCASTPKPLDLPVPATQQPNDIAVIDEIQKIEAEIARADDARQRELKAVEERVQKELQLRPMGGGRPIIAAGPNPLPGIFGEQQRSIYQAAEADRTRIELEYQGKVSALKEARVRTLPAAEPVGSGQASLSSSSEPAYVARCRGCQQVEVFFATDRRTGPQPLYFTEELGEKLRYGRGLVSIPAKHRPGALESPATFFSVEFAFDPRQHIVMDVPRHLRRKDFYTQLKQRTASSKKVLLFIHGYNVTFRDAMRRLAQLKFDLTNAGTPVLYSWPSGGELSDYGYDKEGIDISKSRLAALLRELAEDSGATNLQIVAHSMGNLVLTKAIEELRIAGYTLKPKVQHLVLAAPDLTVDYFKHIATALASNAQHVTLYASKHDRALKASELAQKRDRIGERIEAAYVVDGIDMIDVSDLNEDFFGLGHSYVFSMLLADLAKVFSDLPPERRYLLPMGQPPARFWRARALR